MNYTWYRHVTGFKIYLPRWIKNHCFRLKTPISSSLLPANDNPETFFFVMFGSLSNTWINYGSLFDNSSYEGWWCSAWLLTFSIRYASKCCNCSKLMFFIFPSVVLQFGGWWPWEEVGCSQKFVSWWYSFVHIVSFRHYRIHTMSDFKHYIYVRKVQKKKKISKPML